MLNNENHDLIQQLSVVSDSLWRIEEYIANAEDCDNCKKLWKNLRDDYEKHVELITEEISNHVESGNFE